MADEGSTKLVEAANGVEERAEADAQTVKIFRRVADQIGPRFIKCDFI